jgi:hypothetical protein
MRKGDKLLGMKYCGFKEGNYFQGRNWHGAEVEGSYRMFRCDCLRTFRLGDGRDGCRSSAKSKAWGARNENRSMRKYDIGKHIPGFN